ncbi:MAG: SDR family NAD(P)-dependent oxidoreductase, partial [Isosphaeraceae bacterium]
SPSARLAPGGVVLVTDDDRGVARALAADLRALGHPVVRVRHGVSEGGAEGVNLTSDAAVSALLDRVREHGPLAGIVHALPLRSLPPAGLDAEAWASRMGPEVRGLFLLARAAAEDLARSAEQGGAALIAATSMGGRFALGDGPFDFFPGQGAVAGLVKTLSREWPGVRARVVDLDPDAEVEVLAADLVHEVRSDDRHAEVGYRDGQRIALRTVPAPLFDSHEDEITLDHGDPIIITGGARGITAAVAADLARRWRPTLLLIGSSPRPLDHDDPDLAPLTTTADIKAALHSRARRAGHSVGPAEIERDFQALRRAREIRANLQTLRATGSVVDYAQADVRDADALGRALAVWREQYGPPVALIHGAGVIQDKLLRDKTPESFDRVLGTKLEGALTLARLVDPQVLKFAALFSSVAGRFGNRGQADYAAANEALNKLALWLDRRWPCRVVSMLWGPWSGVGMVSEIEGHLGKRGLGLIPPEIGRARLADELRLGRKGDVEVLVTADLGPLGEPADPLAKAVML